MSSLSRFVIVSPPSRLCGDMKPSLLLPLLLTGCGSIIAFEGQESFDEGAPPPFPDDTSTEDSGGGDTAADTSGDSSGDTSGDTSTDTSGDTDTGEPSPIEVHPYKGTWAPSSTPSALGIGVHPWFVAVADFDGDGDDDLAYSWNVNLFGGDEVHLRVRFQDATGALSGEVNMDVGHTTRFAGSFRAADFDGDGDADLVQGHDDGVTVYLADGAGGFDGGTDHLSSESSSVRVGDITGDGDLDIVAVGVNGDIQVWNGDGSGGFSAGWSVSGYEPSYDGEAVTLVDLDHDGLLDLVIADGYYPGQLFAGLINDGSGGFDTSAPLSTPMPAAVPLTVTLGAHDIDGDGWEDVLASGGFYNNWRLYLGAWSWDGSDWGPFMDLAEPAGSAITGVTAGDLDGDGDEDLFAANALYMNGIFLFDEGGGVWSTTTIDLGLWNQSDIFPDPIAVGDLNSDGCGDLVWRTDEDVIVAHGSGC